MLVDLFALLQTPQVGAEAWEIAKSVMLSLSTLGVGYLVKTVRVMEFSVRALEITVVGVSGQNGLKSQVGKHDSQIDELEDWRTKLDTASAIERELYEGEERRQRSRRLRDKLLNNERLTGEQP